jgi:hypothetical protein
MAGGIGGERGPAQRVVIRLVADAARQDDFAQIERIVLVVGFPPPPSTALLRRFQQRITKGAYGAN